MTKFCKDCRHSKRVEANLSCTHPLVPIYGPDLQTGQTWFTRAYYSREQEQLCGYDGRYWEKKYSWWQIFKGN